MSILNHSDLICKLTLLHLIVRTHFCKHFDLLLKNLMDSDACLHTYQPNVIRPLLLDVQNIHITTAHEDIMGGLLDLGHHITNADNIKRFSDKPN